MGASEGGSLAGRRRTDSGGEQESTAARVRRAAVELFAERGFHGTGIRDLATAAGIGTSSLYHYMGTKDDLLADIMVETTLPLGRAAERMLSRVDDPATRLATLVEHHVWLHARRQQATSVTDTEVRALTGEHRTRVLAIRDAYENCWRTTIRQGVASGRFSTAHPEIVATALLQMSTGVASWFSESGDLSLHELCFLYADWALAMVKANEDGSPVTRRDLAVIAPPGFMEDGDDSRSGEAG